MATQDPRLIRLVAARYHQMQGLTRMADAFVPLYVAAAYYVMLDDWWQAGLFLAGMILYMWSRHTWMRRRINAYYSGRFGRTGWIETRENLGFWFFMAIGFNDSLRDMFQAPVYVRIAFMLAALCAYPLWIAVRDFPFRLHWLAVFVAGFAAAIRIPFVPVGQGGDLWVRDSNVAIGLALLAAGALDHLLLTYALGGGAPEASRLEEERPSA